MYTMRPAEFEYTRAASLEEAFAALAAEDARPLAGGHSLLPMMKLRLACPAAVVDISRIPGLDGIRRDGDVLRIGALATHAAVAASDAVREGCPVLAETAAGIGDPQVRNRGTIGGSLAHADPGADYPTVVTALGATVTVASTDGTREVAAGDFFVGVFTTAVGPGELVTEVAVPAVRAAAYVKHAHPASGYAVVGAAACVTGDGVRIAVGGATPGPVRATAAEQRLAGTEGTPAAIAAAAAEVPAALGGAVGDTYASAEYRVHLAEVLVARALTAAYASGV